MAIHSEDLPEEYLLARRTADIRLLTQFATHSSPLVRSAVASNRATPQNTLLLLLKDAHPGVCGSVLAIRPTDIILLNVAIADGKWREELYWLLRLTIISHPFTPVHMLRELWGSGTEGVRLGIVNRHDCPQNFLEECADVPYVSKPRTNEEFMQQELRRRACARLGLPMYPNEYGNGK